MNALAADAPPLNPVLTRLMGLARLHETDQALLVDAFGATYDVSARRDILAQGEPVRQPLILVEGWAYSAHLLRDGRRQVLHVLLPGDLIGSYPHPNARALATVTALTKARLCPAPTPLQGDAGEGLAAAYA